MSGRTNTRIFPVRGQSCCRSGRLTAWAIGFLIAICTNGMWHALAAQRAVAAHDSHTADRRAMDELLARRVTVHLKNVSRKQAIDALSSSANVLVQYRMKMLNAYPSPVTVQVTDVPLGIALESVLDGTSLRVIADGEDHLAIAEGKTLSALDSVRTGITGLIVDSASGSGLSGVLVQLQGTPHRVLTENDGRFALLGVPSGNYTVLAKRLGYRAASRNVVVPDGPPVAIRVKLATVATALSEVVTTATGGQRRLEVANDVVTINADSLLRVAPVRSVTGLLSAARVPGVEVTPSSGLPGAPSRIRIRGPGSMSLSNDPIVIVDGIRISGATSSSEVVNKAQASVTTVGVGTNNAYVASRLNDIDPNSIEKLEILKGPSAASLYGTDAANGVIIITTKRGQPGQTHVSLNVNHDWNTVPYDYQPLYTGWGKLTTLGFDIPCSVKGVLDGDCIQDTVSTFNPLNSALATNQASGRNTTYSATVSGGSQRIQYSVTTSYQDQLGPTKLPVVSQIRLRRVGESPPWWLVRPDGLLQTNVTSQLTVQPTSALDMALTLQGTNVSSRSANAPLQSTYNNFSLYGGFLDTLDFFSFSHCVSGGCTYTFTQSRASSEAKTGGLGLTVDWRPWAWFRPNITTGVTRTRGEDRFFDLDKVCTQTDGCQVASRFLGLDRQLGRIQTIVTARATNTLPLSLGRLDRILSLKPSFGVNLTRNLAKQQQVIADPLLDSVTRIQRDTVLRWVGSNTATAGWYVDVVLGVFQRWYTTVGFRRDIGSALSGQIPSPTYPKFGTTWLVSDEPWFPKSNVLNSFRLRASYGHSAVQPDAAQLRGTYNAARGIVSGQVVTDNILLTNFGNVRLKPERAVELEYGFDAQLFADRTLLNLTVAPSWRRNELITRTLAPSAGGPSSYTENVGQVYRRSIEASVDQRLLNQRGIQWNVSLRWSTLLDRVDKLGDGVLPFGNDAQRIVEGYPLFGVWQRPVVTYNDVNGNGRLQPDEVVIGDSLAYVGWGHPKYAMTYSSQLSFFNGRLAFTGDLAYDGQFTQIQQQYDGWGLQDLHAPLSEQAKAITAGGYDAATEGGYSVPATGNRQTISTLRFNSASATVELPARWAQRLRASRASISLQGSNLGLWTQYRGNDPGVNSTPIGESVVDDGYTIPQPRTYALSLRLNW